MCWSWSRIIRFGGVKNFELMELKDNFSDSTTIVWPISASPKEASICSLQIRLRYQTASYAAVRSTNTSPAFFLASKKSSMFWVNRTTWSTADFPRQNPACSLGRSRSIFGSMRGRQASWGSRRGHRAEISVDNFLGPPQASSTLELRLQALFFRSWKSWVGASRRKGSHVTRTSKQVQHRLLRPLRFIIS